MPPEPESAPSFFRLHPAVIALALWRVLKGWTFPLFLLFFVGAQREGIPVWVWIGLGSAGVGTLATIAQALSVRYGVADGKLVVRSGVLGRQKRVIPLARIQNVDLRQQLIHRMLDVYEVRIETAGGSGESEAHLLAVSFARAEAFRAEVFGAPRSGPAAPTARAPGPTRREPEHTWPIARASFEDLLLAGATANRLGVILAGFFGLLQMMGEVGEDASGPVVALVEATVGAGPQAQVILAIGTLLAVLVGGWIISIVWTLLTFHGFELVGTKAGLRRRHGLFNRFEGNVPLPRIQVLRLERSWLRRRIGRASLFVDTAGSAKEADMAGAIPLHPLAHDQEVAALARAVFPDLLLEAVRLRPVHPRSLRRGFFLLLRSVLVASALLAAFWSTRTALWAGGLALLPCWWLARARYRVIGWAEVGRFLVAQSGVLLRRTSVVPLAKIQSVSLLRNPMQRRLGLSDLVLATAGTGPRSRVRIPDLGHESARELFERFAAASARHASRRDAV